MDGMDLLQGVQDADAEGAMPDLPPDMGNFKMPSMEQMMDLISKMDITDEEKAKIMEGFTSKADVLSKLAGQGAGRISETMSRRDRGGIFDPASGGGLYILWVIFLVAFLSVFAFFGFRLYKSLTDKEQRKRNEKRKPRIMRKNK